MQSPSCPTSRPCPAVHTGLDTNRNHSELEQLKHMLAISIKIGNLFSASSLFLPCTSRWKKPLQEASRLFLFFPALHKTRSLAKIISFPRENLLASYVYPTLALITMTHSLLGNTSKRIDSCCRATLGISSVFNVYKDVSALYQQWNKNDYKNSQTLAHIALILKSGLEFYTHIRPHSSHIAFLIGGFSIAALLLSSNSDLDLGAPGGCC